MDAQQTGKITVQEEMIRLQILDVGRNLNIVIWADAENGVPGDPNLINRLVDSVIHPSRGKELLHGLLL